MAQVSKCVAVCCSVLQYVAVRSRHKLPSVLQYVAVCCSVLQCVAVYYSEFSAQVTQVRVLILFTSTPRMQRFTSSQRIRHKRGKFKFTTHQKFKINEFFVPRALFYLHQLKELKVNDVCVFFCFYPSLSDIVFLERWGSLWICSALQHTAAYCSTLQYTATHCNTLRHTATYCNGYVAPYAYIGLFCEYIGILCT